jgi:hypothetical protein
MSYLPAFFKRIQGLAQPCNDVIIVANKLQCQTSLGEWGYQTRTTAHSEGDDAQTGSRRSSPTSKLSTQYPYIAVPALQEMSVCKGEIER